MMPPRLVPPDNDCMCPDSVSTVVKRPALPAELRRKVLGENAARLLERLTESSHGQLLFELAHSRADGTTHLLLAPLELIEKIALLIPPPRFHTLRVHGVLGPAAGWRSAVIPRRPAAVDDGPPAAGPSGGTGPPAERSPGSWGAPSESSSWAALLRRAFALDVFKCPRCGGRRRIVGAHTGGESLRGVLARLGLVSTLPSPDASRSPPRATESSPQPLAIGLPRPDGSGPLAVLCPPPPFWLWSRPAGFSPRARGPPARRPSERRRGASPVPGA